MKRSALRLTGALAGLVMCVVMGSPAAAHSSSTPSPNGVSPWHYSESWTLIGSWYGEGLHVDYHNGEHYSDYYGLDFGLKGSPCYKRLYPIWDGMTVATVDRTIGRLTMTKYVNGVKWRIKYMHMDSINVNVGQTVGTTTLVGYTGNKGQSSGCHLHISTQHWSGSTWVSHPPSFCGRTYPHDHTTAWKGC
ncbi:peptidoglycan DD-metalloendopeptidase family protein [Streptomyces sp. HB2AG]|uniref:peptidoglycan DD-metalloendopeptidase family protein n=1 Tax=Streptomyces sp. HB2AG TaxID=2983400 RepID=UPI0022AA624D|nr:peptidoglycan DD-metalloendopeptidase family protein [Streptomyces sp. HB2AG]MCZ2526198.1 peptidoglycan DD-metalloendopeptidase family protein [Streptomyces sp. HB2AG]